MTGATQHEPGSPSPATVPPTMRALRIHAWGERPRLEELPTPLPGPGEVLVATFASVVSHLDVTVSTGEFPVQPDLPYIPGVEGAGRVVVLGDGVEGAAVPVGGVTRLYGSGLGTRRPGCWAEFVTVPAKSLRPVPNGLSPVTAAAIGSSGLTAWSALFSVGDFNAAMRVGVTGATGAVGSLVLAFALAAGAQAPVGFVRSMERVGSIPDGVEVLPLDGGAESPSGSALDLLVDTIGGSGLSERIGWIRPGGALVLVGYTAGTQVTVDLPTLLSSDVRVLPVNMMRRSQGTAGIEADILAQAVAGEVTVATEPVSAGEVVAALDRLSEGRVQGRLVVVW